MSDFLKHALALAGYGYRVFPLEVNGKKPALKGWQRMATTDPQKIEALWTDWRTGEILDHNIGIATGDGLVVVDVDVKDGVPLERRIMVLEVMYGELPETYTVETASGGRHYYFSVGKDDGIRNSAGKLEEGVDIRGDGGYVVAAGSRVGDRDYRGGGSPAVRADLGGGILAALTSKGSRSRQQQIDSWSGQADREGGSHLVIDAESAAPRAIAYLKTAEPAIEGNNGDNHTIVVANHVLDFGLSVDKATELLNEHWNARCVPPWDPADLRYKVASAGKSRQAPIGIAAPEAEFEPVEVEDRRTKPAKGKLYYERWRDAALSTGSPYLIKGWYDYGAMVVTYGESNSGKTNVVMSQAFAIATGQRWAESKCRQGLVVYVAAEGGRGVRKRIAAHHKKYGQSDIPFALVPCPIDLMRPAGDTKALIALIKEVEAEFGQTCVMIVLDTLSRVLAGGNENAPEDMGALVIHCDRIREATNATVHLIHHSGKNKAAGARGHSLLRAATDTEIEVADKGIEAKKQRDMETSQRAAFTYDRIIIGRDEDGDPITSIVTLAGPVSEFDVKVSPAAESFLEVLRAIEENSDNPDIAREGTAWSEWWKSAISSATEGQLQSVKTRQGMAKLCNQLQQNGLIVNVKRNQWITAELQQVQLGATE